MLRRALHNVFWMCAALSVIGLLLAFQLPTEKGAKREEDYSPEGCEKLLVEEMATIDAEHEPSAGEKLQSDTP